jgi:hypothetical protein
MTVDDELEALEEKLTRELVFQLNFHVNMTHWEEMDRLDNDDWENINATLRDVFAPYVRQYGYTAAEPILQDGRNALVHVVWAAMNVPFPRNPFEHAERVVDNTLNVFLRTTYPNLRTEMIMVNHYATVIQRNWRRTISDPAYLVCRKRLMYEFKKISSETDMNGDIFRVSSGL